MKAIDINRFTLEDLTVIDRALENIIEMYECHEEDEGGCVDEEYVCFTRTHYKVLRSIENMKTKQLNNNRKKNNA